MIVTIRYRRSKRYPDYRVGEDGSVWSKKSGRWKRLKPGNQKSGHLFVHIRRKDKLVTVRVHTLVLLAFVGPCPPGMEACHEDGNPANNRLDNLRWDTHVNNERDKVRHGTTNRGTRNGSARLDEQKVREIRRRLADGESKAQVARDFEVSYMTITFVERRLTWGWL